MLRKNLNDPSSDSCHVLIGSGHPHTIPSSAPKSGEGWVWLIHKCEGFKDKESVGPSCAQSLDRVLPPCRIAVQTPERWFYAADSNGLSCLINMPGVVSPLSPLSIVKIEDIARLIESLDRWIFTSGYVAVADISGIQPESAT